MAKRRPRGRVSDSSQAEDSMVPLIRLAGQQIDAFPGGRLAWLLEFIRQSPALWQPADREAHGNRLLAFIYTPMAPTFLRRGQGNIQPLTPAGAVETLQTELRDWLQKVVSDPAGTVSVPTEGLEKALFRATKPGEKPAIFGRS